ncbi:helix-turn-helix domain-containing protein [Devosia beringensis]|uniref:helix-turn-helix domain-containing protein n=1 Tax=Devosia beringensis TaxID=2657486 RepID=UPI00186B5E52|nr:helix-turn-helix domain-containing protein [Devosia beringensis]
MQLSDNVSPLQTQTLWPSEGTGTGAVRLLAPYDALFREGDDTVAFYEILSGAVRAYKIFPDGRRQIVAFAFPGDIVGFGHGDTYRFDCDSLTTTRVRVIHKLSLLRAMRDRPELAEKLLEVARGEVETLQDLSLLLCRKTAIERIASFLLTMARKSADPASGERLPLPMCRADIADYLGLTIETVSRNMTRLRSLRIIDLPDRGSFQVRSLERLRQLAECDGNSH